MITIQHVLQRLRNANPYALSGTWFTCFVLVYVILKIWVYPPLHNVVSYTNHNNNVFGLGIPANLEFCGELIPTNNMAIKKDLEREFVSDKYWRANSKVLFAKANRWFPVIEPILKQEGIPDDFKYLAVIESHLSNVSSPAGAAGFWQLVPSSAYGYGLEVNDLIDERYHVEKSTRAACKHIKDAYLEFKNWTLSAAAYNRGINGIKNALECQKTDNYYDLLLNAETGSFVYRILAYKTVLSNPTHFGIKPNSKQRSKSQPWTVLKVDTTVHDLKYLARKAGCSVSLIKQCNPWLLANCIVNPAGKVYHIQIPKRMKGDFQAYIQDLRPEGRAMEPDQPLGTDAEAALKDSVTVELKAVQFTVRVEEPVKKLAEFFNLKLEEVCKWNNLKEGDMLTKGQVLTLYFPKH